MKSKTKNWLCQTVVTPKPIENKDAGFLIFGEAGLLIHSNTERQKAPREAGEIWRFSVAEMEGARLQK